MKNDLTWTKTILLVYKYLERICGAIDKIIMQRALGSTNIVGQNYFYNNTLTVTQKIIDLSERKVTLINLKVLIEDALKELDEEDSSLLIEKYVDGIKSKVLADMHEVSLRTIFRKLTNAEQSMKNKLSAKGYNDSKLREFLSGEMWINNVYHSLQDNEENLELSNAFLTRAASV